MPLQQQIFALMLSLVVFAFTINLVRRKKLREEYSTLWLATSAIMFLLVLRYDWLVTLTEAIGAVLPTTTLFIGSIVFLMLIAVQFSMKISTLTDQVKNLSQDNALLRAEMDKMKEKRLSVEG